MVGLLVSFCDGLFSEASVSFRECTLQSRDVLPPLTKQKVNTYKRLEPEHGNFAHLSKVQQIPTWTLTLIPTYPFSFQLFNSLLRAQPLEGLLLLQPPCLPCLLSAKLTRTHCHQFMVYFTKLCSNHIHPYPVILYVWSFTNDSGQIK